MALANQIGLSSKYVSERHALASQSKFTAGEVNKILKKKGITTSAKEIVEAYSLLGRRAEWHHSGFYKSNGKSTMGRTFFFDEEDVEFLAENWIKVSERKAEIEAERKIKEETKVQGFYYSWDYDYSGSYGKKRNYKVLNVFEGSELKMPKNFTSCSLDEFDCAKLFIGRKYYGWAEPSIDEFSKEKYDAEMAKRHEVEFIKKSAEAEEKRVIDFVCKEYKKLNDADKIIIAALLNDGGFGKNARIPLLVNKNLGEAIIKLAAKTRRQIQDIIGLQFTYELYIVPQDLIDSIKNHKLNNFKTKVENMAGNILLAWKNEGCIHPCPAEVLAAKTLSGLTWSDFIKTI